MLDAGRRRGGGFSSKIGNSGGDEIEAAIDPEAKEWEENLGDAKVLYSHPRPGEGDFQREREREREWESSKKSVI